MSNSEINSININIGQNINPVSSSPSVPEEINIFPEKSEKNDLVNGEIDDFSQGELGDCSLLATLIAFNHSKTGRNTIKKAISTTDEGYSVYFKKLKKSYEITNEELEAAVEKGYATGLNDKGNADYDVVLMELAFEKLCNEQPSSRKSLKMKLKDKEKYKDKLSIESEYSSHFMELLTGKQASTLINWLGIGIGMNHILNKLQKNSDFLACANFDAPKEDKKVKVGNEEYILCDKGRGHAYCIKSVDSESVTLVNPHCSNEEITISRKDFLKNVSEINYLIFD